MAGFISDLTPTPEVLNKSPSFPKEHKPFPPVFLDMSSDNVAGRRGSQRQLGSRLKEASLYRLQYLILSYCGKLEAKKMKR